MRRTWSLVILIVCALAASVAVLKSRSEETTDAPLPAEEAARTMIVPEGFRVTVFAAEPDVRQPIGSCIDDRGRLWVAEAYNYPNHGTTPGDRILIFEDADGDGRFDNRTVFYDGLNYVTGIEVGFGGVWVMSPPYFYFIADRNGDDRPDGKPEVLLDGFGNHANSHNLANAFAWGPDGWLYGTHGRTNWSLIGTPGTPESERIRFDGGVYRYHPIRRVWEPFADGTTNPWGIDWNDYGDAFVCNCVDPHLFQVIQGAHYEPWRGRKSSQHAYERIASIADHLHFVGTANVRDGLGSDAEDVAGGGHAHCGTMVYLGDNWPERYRNTIFMHNIHGKRINNDIPRRRGSGYVASHGPDLMRCRDQWFMGVTLQYGPDGAVYSIDWSDTGECHSVKNTHRQTGRIYKIAYGSPKKEKINLATASDDELVALQLHRNDWFVRHARRLLQERFAAGADMSAANASLKAMFAEQTDVTRQLRALWCLWVTEGIDNVFLLDQLDHESEYVRGWVIRLLGEDRDPPPKALGRFRRMAENDPSPLVRLQLASLLQRLKPTERWAIAQPLLAHGEDADDPNLPLMYWYGIEPLVTEDLERFASLAAECEIPLVRRHIARRIASLTRPGHGLASLTGLLETSDDDDVVQDILNGILTGLEGRRALEMPANWPQVRAKLNESEIAAVREDALRLSLVFDDPAAQKALFALASDATGPSSERQQALRALIAKRTPSLAGLLLKLIDDPAVRAVAVRGLAEYDHPATVDVLLKKYPEFDPTTRQDALQTLASRAKWGSALLDAVERNIVPRTDLTAFTARQLQALGDKRLAGRVRAIWGEVRTTPAEKARQIERYKSLLTTESLAGADLTAGRMLFEKTCANCHRLFDSGGKIGPDITGSQRTNLDYLLENLVDPSAAVSNDYRMLTVVTSTGRVISGLLESESNAAVTIQTANERVVVPIDEIEDRSTASVSMMPEGLLQQLTDDQVRDLVAYLQSETQVPLPVGSSN